LGGFACGLIVTPLLLIPAAQSLREFLGEAKLKAFLNFTLSYLAALDIPVKRGTFIELRCGMINVSPIGRNCSQVRGMEYAFVLLLVGWAKWAPFFGL